MRGWPSPRYCCVLLTLVIAAPTVCAEQPGFQPLPSSEWFGSSAGLSTEVLPPWTPLKARKVKGQLAVECWGRLYSYRDCVLPSQVQTAGQQILDRPVRLVLQTDGKTEAMQSRGIDLLSVTDASVESSSFLRSAKIAVSLRSTTEYDGLQRLDMHIAPLEPRVTLSEVTLEIPFRAEFAKLIHWWPPDWQNWSWASTQDPGWSKTAACALGTQHSAWRHDFTHFVWVGWDDGGLTWFCESSEGWTDAGHSALEILREGKAVVLRARIVSRPTGLRNPLHYSFGLQATPLRPIPKDWRSSVAQLVEPGAEKQRWRPSVSVEYPAKNNLRLDQGTLEMWLSPSFDARNPEAENPPEDHYGHGLFMLFTNPDDQTHLYWNIAQRALVYYQTEGPKTRASFSTPPLDWRKGEWHHVAFTWGRRARFYVDGRLVQEAEVEGLKARRADAPTFAGAAPMQFGAISGENVCRFIFDEIRISGIERTEFDVTKPPSSDEHTLLLDHLDEFIQRRGVLCTHATKIAETSGAKGGSTRGGQAVDGRFGQAISVDREEPGVTTVLDVAKSRGVKTAIMFEMWTPYENYTRTTPEKAETIRSFVEACHQRGMKAVLYFGYEMSEGIPEYPTWKEWCLNKLPGTERNPAFGVFQRQDGVRSYVVCYKSPWQDYMSHGVKRVLADFDLDGVYLDATAWPFPCSNYLHRCGYKTEKGWVPTAPIFAVRRFMQRIYKIVKDSNSNGEVIGHFAGVACTPTLAYCTQAWDGEHITVEKLGEDPLRRLPPESVRAHWTQRKWGIPVHFLFVKDLSPYFTRSLAEGYFALHDVCLAGEVREVIARFAGSGAQWLPYWGGAKPVVRATPPTTRVSVYLKRSKAALLVVSNLSYRPNRAQVALNSVEMGFGSKTLRASDAVYGDSLAARDNTLALDLGPMETQLVLLETE